jgi:DNA-binding CsgD family transcriptional regulator
MGAPLATGDAVRMWLLGGELQVAVVRGRLAGVAERAGRELAGLESPRSATLFTTSGLTYEALSRAAFFAGDHDVLVWAANLLERVASTRITRRYAAAALSFLCVAEAALRGDAPGESIPPDLVALNQASVTGGGLLQREFAYLAPATADPAWIAAERANIQRFAEGDERARCFVSMCDALLALRGGDDRAAEHHWQEMLAIASEHGFGLMWIDALEGLAICAVRAGEHDVAARLASAAEAARDDRGYRYRYPHVAELPAGSDEGQALSLEDVTGWIRRTRGERVRPVSGWSSLTPTEVEVARAVGAGLSNQQVADRLFVSVATVKTHLRHVFGKLSIENRAQLVAVVAMHDR